MSVWVLARRAGRGDDGEPIHEYFSTQVGSSVPRVSPFRADAVKFHDARAAYECAETHPALRDSDEWRVLEVVDRNRTRSGCA